MLKKKLLALCIFFLSIFLISQSLNKPFWGEHDWNGVRYGNIARNYLRYGLIDTRLGQVENSGYANKDEFQYYTHYPPLLPLLISQSYKLFGISEWSTRLVPLLATASCIVLIFLIGSTIWNMATGLFASLLSLSTPMVLYFGKNPVHEPITLFFILFSLFGYINFLKYSQREFKYMFIIGLILAEATAWAGYFLIPAMTLVYFFKQDFKAVKAMLPLWLLSIGVFLIHLSHTFLLTGSLTGGNLYSAFEQRSGLRPDIQPTEFNLLNYLYKIKLWFFTLYTTTLTLLALFWLITRKKFGITNRDWVIFTLGILGLIYLIVLPNAVFIHNYLVFYFLPPLSLAGALGIQTLIKLTNFRRFSRIFVVIMLLLVILERRSFFNALDQSQSDKLGVEIGKAINQQTSVNDIILVSPLNFTNSADNFLKFYSDRKLIYSDNLDAYLNIKVVIDQQNGKFEIIRGNE